jgi:hypothetical protein
MRHFRQVADSLVELTPAEIEQIKTDGRYYFSPRILDGEQVHVQWVDAEIAARKAEESLPRPSEPFQDRMRKAFEQLTLDKQERFADDILKAAFFLERGNLPMVASAIKQAGWKVQLPGDEDVKAIIDAAMQELGVV